jgi:hypothetical protein
MSDQTKRCPFCAEEIHAAAIRCKHCAMMLDGSTGRGPGADSRAARGRPQLSRWIMVGLVSVLAVGLIAYLATRNWMEGEAAPVKTAAPFGESKRQSHEQAEARLRAEREQLRHAQEQLAKERAQVELEQLRLEQERLAQERVQVEREQIRLEQKRLAEERDPAQHPKVDKLRVRKSGALAALNASGTKVMGSKFGAGDFNVDSSYAPVGDLAIAGLSDGGGGTADSDPFDLSSADGPGGSSADGNALSGRELISGKKFEELSKKRLSSSVKNPKFKEKSVRITPSANFDMEGSGKLDRDVVKKYIRKQLAKIRWCYQKAFQKNPNLEGDLTVSFIISPTGSVMSAKVVSSTLEDKDLEGCIERKILTWRFPAPKGGGIVKVKYPFALSKQ